MHIWPEETIRAGVLNRNVGGESDGGDSGAAQIHLRCTPFGDNSFVAETETSFQRKRRRGIGDPVPESRWDEKVTVEAVQKASCVGFQAIPVP